MKQGGHHANVSGKVLESIVESSLHAKGFNVINYKIWEKDKEKSGNEILVKNVPYKSIYKHASKTEFLILSSEFKVHTRIECKWQQASGSVDEKFPYLFLNCAEMMTEPHIIILLDGGGAKKGAIEWLANACEKFNLDSNNNRKIDLMTSTQFLQWVNSKFK